MMAYPENLNQGERVLQSFLLIIFLLYSLIFAKKFLFPCFEASLAKITPHSSLNDKTFDRYMFCFSFLYFHLVSFHDSS